jgi:tripartite-type tricarboxylate transporter receptor subunit TctC
MRKIIAILLLTTLLLLSLLVSSCATKENTLSPVEFYEGKTINMVVNSDAGSLVDLVGRVIANHLAADIKGNVIVENRREAGGLEGTNYLSEANPDGLTLGIISAIKFLTNKILNDPAALYEIEDFTYLLKVDSQQTYFFVSTTGPYQTVNDLKAGTGLKIAAGTASGYITLAGMTVIDLLDLDAKVVTGFENNTARSLATQRGEVIGYAISIAAVKAELEAGTLKPLFVIGTQRDPTQPDIPAITELVSLSEEDLALVELWENALSSGNILAAPAGIPDDKLDYMYELAEGWYQDESFQQEIDQVSGYKVAKYTSGELLTESIFDMAATLESFQARFAEMIEKYRL